MTNPNCSTIMLALALAPLHAKFGVESVIATTMQAFRARVIPALLHSPLAITCCLSSKVKKKDRAGDVEDSGHAERRRYRQMRR